MVQNSAGKPVKYTSKIVGRDSNDFHIIDGKELHMMARYIKHEVIKLFLHFKLYTLKCSLKFVLLRIFLATLFSKI